MSRKDLTLGIFGFGCVGQGLYEVLSRTNGLKASIKKICIKNPEKDRSLAPSLFTTEKNELLYDDEIDVIVELINDEDPAFEIVKTAMQNGKSVVSASKKMIAKHLPELVRLQELYNVSFLYEGACCASIPIIRNLEEYYDNDLLHAVTGIFNGSTNYILTKIFEEKKTYVSALAEAQELGFAETDPKMDVEGFDPKFKLCILLFHAFGMYVEPADIFNYGIQNLNDFDINYANEKRATIKLLAVCRKINDAVVAYVMPHFVNLDSKFYLIRNEYNAVLVESAFSDQQVFTGKGAGSTPTGSAVLSDISALSYGYKYEYRKSMQSTGQAIHSQNKQLKNAINGLAVAQPAGIFPYDDLPEVLTPPIYFTNQFSIRIFMRFRNGQDFDAGDFIQIMERYRSGTVQFLVGTINLETLQNAGWLRNENISIIAI